MSCKRPDVARGLIRMKTETDKVIVASNEVRGIIEESTRKKGKKAQLCKSINTSVGVQNCVAIWRTIDGGRD